MVRDGLPVDSGYHVVLSRMGISNKYVSNAGSLDMPPIHERTISRVYLGDHERNRDVLDFGHLQEPRGQGEGRELPPLKFLSLQKLTTIINLASPIWNKNNF